MPVEKAADSVPGIEGGREGREADGADAALVAAARSGEARAFERLLGRHEARVLRVLRLMGVPAQDREDVAQEVFVRVFRHLGGFRPGRPFRSWVYRIAVNASHDYRRRAYRRADEAAWEEGLDPAGETRPPDEQAAGRQLRDRMLDALTSLSERERAVFVLRELEGLETREVARALAITTVTVRRHLGLARRRLRRELGAGGEDSR